MKKDDHAVKLLNPASCLRNNFATSPCGCLCTAEVGTSLEGQSLPTQSMGKTCFSRTCSVSVGHLSASLWSSPTLPMS